MKNTIVFGILLMAFSFGRQNDIVPKRRSYYNLCDSKVCFNNFKVLKIESTQYVYLIYACRNDSIFKIVSAVGKPSKSHKILTGHSYNFHIKALLPDVASKKHIKGIKYNGIIINLEDQHDSIGQIVWNLYECTNLKGLCVVEN